MLLVRNHRVVARQELRLDVVRSGTAAWIADIARDQPVFYGLACIIMAAFAGWLGSVREGLAGGGGTAAVVAAGGTGGATALDHVCAWGR